MFGMKLAAAVSVVSIVAISLLVAVLQMEKTRNSDLKSRLEIQERISETQKVSISRLEKAASAAKEADEMVRRLSEEIEEKDETLRKIVSEGKDRKSEGVLQDVVRELGERK